MDEKETVEPEEGTQEQATGQTEQEMVSPEEADDGSLEAYLKTLREDEEEAAPEPEEQPEIEQEEEAPPQEEPAPEPEEAPPVKPEAKPEPTQESEAQKLKRQVDGLELLVRRRTQDIENLRRRLEDELRPIKQRIEGKVHEDQYEAIKDIEAAREKEQAIAELESTKGTLERDLQARKAVAAHVKPDDGNIDEMAASLIADGVPEATVTAFRQNPFSVAQPETLIQIAKRAKAERQLKQMFLVAKALHEENKKLKGKPKQVLDNVQRALKNPPSINGSSGRGSTPDNLTNVPVHKLSEQQLRELEKRLRGS